MVTFLKTKGKVLEALKAYKTMVELQKGKQIKMLRTDNGGEYIFKAFRHFCLDSGIVYQTTPKHNGVAERKNYTIMECVLHCLICYQVLNYSIYFAPKPCLVLYTYKIDYFPLPLQIKPGKKYGLVENRALPTYEFLGLQHILIS